MHLSRHRDCAAAAVVWSMAPAPGLCAAGGPDGKRRRRMCSGIDKPVRVVRGRSHQLIITLTNDTYWVLRGAVFIADPAGDSRFKKAHASSAKRRHAGPWLIERGGQIFANGSAVAPIVFTSDQPVGSAVSAATGWPGHQRPRSYQYACGGLRPSARGSSTGVLRRDKSG